MRRILLRSFIGILIPALVMDLSSSPSLLVRSVSSRCPACCGVELDAVTVPTAWFRSRLESSAIRAKALGAALILGSTFARAAETPSLHPRLTAFDGYTAALVVFAWFGPLAWPLARQKLSATFRRLRPALLPLAMIVPVVLLPLMCFLYLPAARHIPPMPDYSLETEVRELLSPSMKFWINLEFYREYTYDPETIRERHAGRLDAGLEMDLWRCAINVRNALNSKDVRQEAEDFLRDPQQELELKASLKDILGVRRWYWLRLGRVGRVGVMATAGWLLLLCGVFLASRRHDPPGSQDHLDPRRSGGRGSAARSWWLQCSA